MSSLFVFFCLQHEFLFVVLYVYYRTSVFMSICFSLSTWVVSVKKHQYSWLFMAALCNRGPLYFCPVVSIYLSIYLSIFFFCAWSQWPEIGCLPYFHTWCGLSANL